MIDATHDDRRRINEIIGHELVADATEQQREEILAAITEHEAGVRELASKIRINPRVHKPIPVLLSKIRSGAHRAPTRNESTNLSQLERAHRAYIAKLADLDKHDAWQQGWTVDDAVAYAIDYTCPGDLEIEAQLRHRAGLPPYIVADHLPPEAEAARRKLAILCGQPPPTPPPLDDDDIPGYGDHT
jgi:hypothetical protein